MLSAPAASYYAVPFNIRNAPAADATAGRTALARSSAVTFSRPKNNSVFSTLVKGALAAAALGGLVYFVEFGAMVEAARRANPLWIVAAVALLPLNVFLEGRVWRVMVRPVTPQIGWRGLYGALLSGFALGLFTPARAGEFVGRAFYLPHADRWETGATVFAQRLLDMAVALDVGLVALGYAWAGGFLPEGPWWIALGAGAFVSVALSALMAAPGRLVGLAERFVSSEKALVRIRFLRRLGPQEMARAAALAFLRYGVYVTQFVLLIRAFVPEGSFLAAYLGIGLVYFAKFLAPSITLMDLGLREGFAVFFLGQLGFPEAAALNAALLLFCLNLALPAAAGVPLLLRLNLGRGASDDAPASAAKPASAESHR